MAHQPTLAQTNWRTFFCPHRCFEPHGTHTRAQITDVRPNLFDNDWKENVGGASWLDYFDGDGVLQYPRAMESRIATGGPCLSNATYESVSQDDKIKSRVRVSGGRTDDMGKFP